MLLKECQRVLLLAGSGPGKTPFSDIGPTKAVSSGNCFSFDNLKATIA